MEKWESGHLHIACLEKRLGRQLTKGGSSLGKRPATPKTTASPKQVSEGAKEALNGEASTGQGVPSSSHPVLMTR
jgi:hypothetical protein